MLVILAVLTALAPLSVDIYTPSLPRIQSDLGGGDWLAQASITACLLGICLGQLLWGPLSDRVGRRPVILVGIAGWTLASAASAVAITSEMLIAARGLAGICGAAGIVAARSVVRDLSSDSRAVASRIGILAVVTAVAPVLAPVAGTAIAVTWGWRADFIALLVLGLLIAAAFAVTIPETLPAGDQSGTRHSMLGSLETALHERELVAVAVALALQSFGFYAYISTTSFIVEREFGYPPATFALVFGTNACAILVANLVFRRVMRYKHPSFTLGAGLAVGAVSGVCLMVAALAHAPTSVLWASSTVFAASAGFVLPSAHSWGQAALVASGAASALTGSGQFLGGVLGSPVTGLAGPTAALLGAVIAVSSGTALSAWAVAHRIRHSPTRNHGPNSRNPRELEERN
ncbi:multidrug effflux MFS transporter [Nocardia vaccinii]|uniref:multidrug effflux MFS transporter n=1 Tax=Nocardia vaccinii TaxID=1822 RepID=UPI0008364856|nr:multidrug effflux MFS transporter [Nocardia vaccinii]